MNPECPQAASSPPRDPLFPLGQVVITSDAQHVAEGQSIDVAALLARHQRGDWGQVPDADARANDAALRHGKRLLSGYGQDPAQLWIITEADRSATTVLRPEEY